MTEFFTYVKNHPHESYLQDYVGKMCEKEHKCQLCERTHSITALKGLLVSRIVRTNEFSWLFILQKQYIGRERYRPTKSIILFNMDFIEPNNPSCLGRMHSNLSCWWIKKEMTNPEWEVYGKLETIEVGYRGVSISTYSICEKDLDLIIDKIIVHEKEVE